MTSDRYFGLLLGSIAIAAGIGAFAAGVGMIRDYRKGEWPYPLAEFLVSLLALGVGVPMFWLGVVK
jgi:hypothetical protein